MSSRFVYTMSGPSIWPAMICCPDSFWNPVKAEITRIIKITLMAQCERTGAVKYKYSENGCDYALNGKIKSCFLQLTLLSTTANQVLARAK